MKDLNSADVLRLKELQAAITTIRYYSANSRVTDQLLVAVLMEQQRIVTKFGVQSDRTAVEWSSILAEEMGEFAQAANDFYFSDGDTPSCERMREEAVQVAAVALTILHWIDN